MTPDQYKAERIKRNLSQAQLAALLGVSRATINGRETGHERYPISTEAGLAVQALPIMPHLKEYTPEERKASGDAFREGSKQRTLAMNSAKAREQAELLKRLENPQLKKK